MKLELTAAIMILASLAVSGFAQDPPPIEAVLGVEADGRATEQWLAMIRKRLPEPRYATLSGLKKPLDPAETLWADLIQSRVTAWQGRRDTLATPFPEVRPPERVLIVMGNRGGNDAFTHDPRTIGFDLSSLQSVYGDASLPANFARIDRIFDHEYTHLLQKAWLADKRYPQTSPQETALLDIWLEGLGNYRSLSPRWRADEGRPSEAAAAALARLEPRFAARMSALACAAEPQARALKADLSRGSFQDKWGALTAALWLEAEANLDPDALRHFVLAGPGGVWDLAARHMPRSLAAVLSEARGSAAICAADRSATAQP